MLGDLANLTAADFAPRIEDNFCVSTTTGVIELRLIAVQSLGNALRAGGAFALSFLSAAGPFLPQAIHRLQHPVLGELDIFLVPLGVKDGGNSYEAVFT